MCSVRTCPKGWLSLLLIAGSAVLLTGCPPPTWSGVDAAREHMTDDKAPQRARATAVLGNAVVEDPKVSDLKLLIDRLTDADLAVRLHAITALEQVAGSRLGYEPWASLSDRHRAVARWRGWFTARVEGGP